MSDHIHPRRRADRGTLIVRASVVAVGLAASVGLLLWEPEPQGPATWSAGNPSVLCTLDATGSFGFQ